MAALGSAAGNELQQLDQHQRSKDNDCESQATAKDSCRDLDCCRVSNPSKIAPPIHHSFHGANLPTKPACAIKSSGRSPFEGADATINDAAAQWQQSLSPVIPGAPDPHQE